MSETKKLPLGRLMASPMVKGMSNGMPAYRKFIADCVARHAAGDWGDVDLFAKAANDHEAKNGGRVLSVWRLPQSVGGKGEVWILTDADRQTTTIFEPHEAEIDKRS